MRIAILFLSFLISFSNIFSQPKVRITLPLLNDWYTVANDTNPDTYNGFERTIYDQKNWIKTDIPHNWDKYEGLRRMKHGNRHGFAWYRKTFSVPDAGKNKQYFLWFEGVGSYATVWLNGIKIGEHAGGRTSFTLDITESVIAGKLNTLAVKADHPADIRNLPWVCGGCSNEWGFSEGSQPMGIFRPVTLIITNPIRVEPFGVHIWNDTTVSEKSATLHLETEIKNYTSKTRKFILATSIYDKFRTKISEVRISKNINPKETLVIRNDSVIVQNPVLWSPDNPYLYTIQSEIIENGKIIDATSTPYGIRWISWPIGKTNTSNQFLLNGKPVFINGTAEYEHNMGQSHAFTNEQIFTRVMQVKAAGYNAFRDAHQPHNLKYQANWDSLGLLWWPQFAAHIWFDTDEFKQNFKQLLQDWVKERRNSPSIILWGLENESTLPTEFAKECSDIIRKLDPTTSLQRKITTCNGGTGTDWNVVQNWSGTYGGNPENYGNEMKKQLLNGEYGAWRSIDLHTNGPYLQNGILSEDRFTLLMESKIRLAESVKDSMCGQFHWLLTSHENPGRTQSGEGFRELDRLGPINYKGLFTPWGEPADAYYMFRSNYAPKNMEPMVYIVSHTWPNRWTIPGIKDSIIVYSNCDEVELFNDINSISLGRRKNPGRGLHFQWDSVPVHYNVLCAVGYVSGKSIATDYIVLNHLPDAPKLLSQKMQKIKSISHPEPGYTYIYRVNCGGPDITDNSGKVWLADGHKSSGISWGSFSWTDDFEELPAFYGSQRRTFNPIAGTQDWNLFQTFRYGRDKLRYEFPLPNGEYLVELYFIEPWYGPNTSSKCNGWRLFDVAINENTLIHNLDIAHEAGENRVLKKSITTTITGGVLEISFPKVQSGQAIISAIAIASKNKDVLPAPAPETNIRNLRINSPENGSWQLKSWMNIGDNIYSDSTIEINQLPPSLFGAEWIQTPYQSSKVKKDTLATFILNAKSDVYVAVDSRIQALPKWLATYNNTGQFLYSNNVQGNYFKVLTTRYPSQTKVTLGANGTIENTNPNMYTVAVVPVSKMEDAVDLRNTVHYEAEDATAIGSGLIIGELGNKKYFQFTQPGNDTIEWSINPGVAGTYSLKFKYINTTGKIIPMQIKIIDANGIEMNKEIVDFPVTSSDKWQNLNTSTGTSINAGVYRVLLFPKGLSGLMVDVLDVK